jgi:hypothetical protein
MCIGISLIVSRARIEPYAISGQDGEVDNNSQ